MTTEHSAINPVSKRLIIIVCFIMKKFVNVIELNILLVRIFSRLRGNTLNKYRGNSKAIRNFEIG